MSPILGIWASSKPGAPATSFESIATVTVGSGGAANVEFTSIPGTYSHLQVRGIVRSTTTADGRASFSLRINSDTGSNYAKHNLIGDGASVSAEGQANKTSMFANAFMIPSATSTASVFGGFIVDILDYANTNKYTTCRNLIGFDNNGTSPLPGRVGLESGLWMNTNAVTSLKFTTDSNWAQYTHFALYGIKGA